MGEKSEKYTLAHIVLETLMQAKGLTNTTLAEITGVTVGAINQITSNRTVTLSKKVRESILAVFPDIDPIWLTTGTGNMYRKKNTYVQKEISEPKKPTSMEDALAQQNKFLQEMLSRFTTEMTEMRKQTAERIARMEEKDERRDKELAELKEELRDLRQGNHYFSHQHIDSSFLNEDNHKSTSL